MSLINQMLRDLDQQRGPAGGAEVAALHGMGLVDRKTTDRSKLLIIATGTLCAIAVSAVLGYWAADKFFAEQTIEQGTRQVEKTGLNEVISAAAAKPHEHIVAEDIREMAPSKAASEKHQEAPVIEKTDSSATTVEQHPTETQGAIASIETEQVSKAVTEDNPSKPVPAARVKYLGPKDKAKRLFNQAQQALASQRTDTASALLEKSLAENPLHIDARIQLAMLMLETGQRESAEALLYEGLSVNPGETQLLHPYAQLLVERGAYLPALQALQVMSDDRDVSPETLALQAGIMTRLQRYADAAKTYKRALQRQPRRPVWWTGLAVALEHDGRTAAALDAYRNASRLPIQSDIRQFVQKRIRALTDPNMKPQG